MTACGFTPEGGTIIDRFMRRAVSQRVFPGAVLLVSRDGEICFHRAYGHGDLFDHQAVTTETVFDLASLTKPLATALAVLDLVDGGSLSLDHKLGNLLPVVGDAPAAAALATATAGITLRQLLDHTSGMAAWRPYFQVLKKLPVDAPRTRLVELLLAEPLEASPGSRFCYSDLGYLLLGEIVAAVSGEGLDSYLTRRILAPLGLEKICFAPLSHPLPYALDTVAATELCPWRGALLKGRVHDDNAYVLGGVAGHAGLFGTAAAVGQLLEHLLKAYHGDNRGPLSPAMIRYAWRRKSDTPHGLGFDFPAENQSSAGGRFSFASVGHLGFTGTSFWIDLPRRITIVLLSNRVHPTRHHCAIRELRPLLHDAIMAALLQA
jgi:CubicO group peptidase (beta-lactamase class C family)